MSKALKWWIGVALVGLLLPTIGLAGGGATPRPLSDFLDAQGSTSGFFPPVPDYSGWADGDWVNFALIDYAGLADAWIEAEAGACLGTHVGGQVKERPSTAGVEVTVKLRTANALTFAQSVADIIDNGFDFLNTDTIFGNKAQDVVDGEPATTGWAHFDVTFTMPTAGAALPDLLDVINTVDYAPATLEFKSQAVGTLADGTPARLRVHQVGSIEDVGGGTLEWVYTVETVDLEALGN